MQLVNLANCKIPFREFALKKEGLRLRRIYATAVRGRGSSDHRRQSAAPQFSGYGLTLLISMHRNSQKLTK